VLLCSDGVQIGAACGVAWLLVWTLVNLWNGKRGYHVIPHLDHLIYFGGLVFDGCIFLCSRMGTGPCKPNKAVTCCCWSTNKAHQESIQTTLRDSAFSLPGEKASTCIANDLHRAAATGDERQMASALGQIATVSDSRKNRIQMLNQGDHRQWTPLHVAAAAGSVGVAKLLLAAGCSPLLRNNEVRPYIDQYIFNVL
jgi:hypothetical protein